jgi:hypothetical protein
MLMESRRDTRVTTPVISKDTDLMSIYSLGICEPLCEKFAVFDFTNICIIL